MISKPKPERRDQICDAAISHLASKGLTGLTPRAIDQRLALPSGTTASYFRTRMQLVQAAAARLVLLDGMDAAGFQASAAGIAAVVERSLASERRERLIARFELLLLAARSPRFTSMRWARELFLAGAEAQLRLADARSPELAAIGVVALIEGLLIHGVIVPGMPRRDRVALVRSMFSGFFDSPTPDEGPKRL